MSATEQKPAEYTELMAQFHRMVAADMVDPQQVKDFIVLNHRVLGDFEKLSNEYKEKLEKARRDGEEKYEKQLKDHRDEVFGILFDTSAVSETKEAAYKMADKLSKKLSVMAPGDLDNRLSSIQSEFKVSDDWQNKLRLFLNQNYLTDSGVKIETASLPPTHKQIDQLMVPLFEKAGLSNLYSGIEVSPGAQDEFLVALGEDEAMGQFLDQERDALLKGVNLDGYLDKLGMSVGSSERALLQEYLEGGAEAAIYRKYAQTAANGAARAAENFDNLTAQQKTDLYLTNNKLSLDTARQALADDGVTEEGVVKELMAGVNNPVEFADNKFIYAVGKLEPSLEAMQQVAQHFGTIDPRTGRRTAYSRSRDQDTNPFIAQAREMSKLRSEMTDNANFMRIAAEMGIPLREGETPTPRQLRRVVSYYQNAPKRRLRSTGNTVTVTMLDRSRSIEGADGDLLFFRDSSTEGAPFLTAQALGAKADADLKDAKVVVIDLDDPAARREAAQVTAEDPAFNVRLSMLDKIYNSQTPEKAQGSVLVLDTTTGDYALLDAKQQVVDKSALQEGSLAAMQRFAQNPAYASVAGDNDKFRKTGGGHNPLESLEGFVEGEINNRIGRYLPKGVVQEMSGAEPLVERVGRLMLPGAQSDPTKFILSGQDAENDGVVVNDAFSFTDVRGEFQSEPIKGFKEARARSRARRKQRRAGRKMAGRTGVERADKPIAPSPYGAALKSAPEDAAAPEAEAPPAAAAPAPETEAPEAAAPAPAPVSAPAPAPAPAPRDTALTGTIGRGQGRRVTSGPRASNRYRLSEIDLDPKYGLQQSLVYDPDAPEGTVPTVYEELQDGEFAVYRNLLLQPETLKIGTKEFARVKAIKDRRDRLRRISETDSAQGSKEFDPQVVAVRNAIADQTGEADSTEAAAAPAAPTAVDESAMPVDSDTKATAPPKERDFSRVLGALDRKLLEGVDKKGGMPDSATLRELPPIRGGAYDVGPTIGAGDPDRPEGLVARKAEPEGVPLSTQISKYAAALGDGITASRPDGSIDTRPMYERIGAALSDANRELQEENARRKIEDAQDQEGAEFEELPKTGDPERVVG